MIDIHIPTSLEYNTNNASLLTTTIKNLSRIEEITGWNKQARAEIEELNSVLKTIEAKQQNATQVISQEQHEYDAKNFITRFFHGRKEKKRWLTEQSRLEREKAQIENVIIQFQSALDFMPLSQDKVKELLEDCKQQKQDLHTEMKVVNDQKSSIRTEAKQEKANTNYGKYGKGDRHLIRLNKKSALKSQNDQKTAIKRQTAELEQIILWLEKF
jgi:chromosome segregation ATPase